jgi:hypothetical protein
LSYLAEVSKFMQFHLSVESPMPSTACRASLVVSVNLIFEAFENIAKNPFLIIETFAWKLYILPSFTSVGGMVS